MCVASEVWMGVGFPCPPVRNVRRHLLKEFIRSGLKISNLYNVGWRKPAYEAPIALFHHHHHRILSHPLTFEQDPAVIVRRDVSVSVEISVERTSGRTQRELFGFEERLVAHLLEDDRPGAQPIKLLQLSLDARHVSSFFLGDGGDEGWGWRVMGVTSDW